MALAVNTEMASNVGAFVDTGTSLTYAFNNVAGTYIVGGAVIHEHGGSRTVSTVTYAAVAVTKFDNQLIGTDGDVWLGGATTAATGSNNVVVTPSGGNITIISGVLTFTGQHASAPSGTAHKATGTGTTPTVDQASTTTGNIVVAVMGGGTNFTGNSGTLSWLKNIDNTGACKNAQSNRAAGTGGTVTMSGTMAGSDSWGIVCNEIIAAAAAGGGGPIMNGGQIIKGTIIRGGRIIV